MSRWDHAYAFQVRRGLNIDGGVDPLSHCGLGLAGESGEVADLIKKSQYKGGKLDLAHLLEELGDALWYLTAIAEMHGWSLADLAIENTRKLQERRGGHYDPSQLVYLS